MVYTEGSFDGGPATAAAGPWRFWGGSRYWTQRRVISRYVRDFKRQIPVTVSGNVDTPTWDGAGSNVDPNPVPVIQVVAGKLDAALTSLDPYATYPAAASDKTALLLINADCVNSHRVTVGGFQASGRIGHTYLPHDAPDVVTARGDVDLVVRSFDAEEAGTEFTVTIGPHEVHLFEIPVTGTGAPDLEVFAGEATWVPELPAQEPRRGAYREVLEGGVLGSELVWDPGTGDFLKPA
jgi:hypothetical protein